jgi:hypothetical protein
MLGQEMYQMEFSTPVPGTVYDPSTGGALSWLDRLQSFGTTIVNLEYMRDINAINLERARQGLAPLSPSTYAPTVNVGVAPDVQRNAMLTLGAIGIGVFALVMLTKKRG